MIRFVKKNFPTVSQYIKSQAKLIFGYDILINKNCKFAILGK